MSCASFKRKHVIAVSRLQFVVRSIAIVIILLSAAFVTVLVSGLSDMGAEATTARHNVFLKLSAPTSLPWGRTVSFTEP